MKKKLISLLLILVLVIGVTVLGVAADEATAQTHSNHCVCGGHTAGVGDHTECTAIENWQPLTTDCFETFTYTKSDGTEVTNCKFKPGSYYMTGYFDLKSVNTALGIGTGNSIWITPGEEVTLCLNGNQMKHTGGRALNINGTFNLTDCSADQSGILNGAGSTASVYYAYAGAQVNIYAGKVYSSRNASSAITYAGVAAHATTDLGAGAEASPSKLTMYGGTLQGRKVTKTSDGKQGMGGALVFFHSTDFTMYGGRIIGASAAGDGGAVCASTSGEVKLLGGSVTGGTAEGRGDGIYTQSNTRLTLGGNVKIDDLYIYTGNTFTVENLTGKVALSTASSNHEVLATVSETEAACFTSNMPANHRLTYADGNLAFAPYHADHCVCGGNLDSQAAITAHGECVAIENWIPLDQETLDSMLVVSMPADTTLQDEDGKGNSSMLRFGDDYDDAYYYLTENVTVSKPIEIHQNDNITICLNGYTFASTTTGNSAIRVWGTLSITDCVGDGQITSSANNKANAPVLYMFGSHADAEKGVVVNLYGGTLRAQDEDTSTASGVISVNNNNATLCTLNIYNGTITGGYGTHGGGINLNGLKGEDSAIVNMYGGSITNGRAATYYGGNVRVTYGEFYMYGGIMSGGIGKYGSSNLAIDMELGYNTSNSCLLDGKVSIGGLGGYGSTGGYMFTLGDNFSTDKVINLYVTNSAGRILTSATPDQISDFASVAEDTYKVAYKAGGQIHLVALDNTEYHCVCGGVPTAAAMEHTCYNYGPWTELTTEFLAGCSTTTNDGSSYVIPNGYYYLGADLTVDKCLRINSGREVALDLCGYTLQDSEASSGKKLLRVIGTLYLTDSSYNAQAETYEDRFQGKVIATKEESGSLAYVSKTTGKMVIYGGNLMTAYTEADTPTYAAIAASGKLTIANGTVTGAFLPASSSGGTITVFDDGCLKVYDGKISGGQAVRGGNIYGAAAETTIEIHGGEISGGQACGAASGSNGGGGNIYSTGKVTIAGGTITDGTASRTQSSTHAYGGNIYMNSTSKTLTITGGTITGGSAVTGGNIFTRGEFTMSDGTITKGVATEAMAGNIRLEACAVNITGGTISDGTASSQGGNAVIRNSAKEIIIKDASFTGGTSTASHGGSVYITGQTGAVTMENVNITGGTAYNRAGNLYITGGSETLPVVTLTNCTITNGTAGSRGGNIYIADIDCTLNNCTATGGKIVLTGAEADALDTYGYNLATNVGNYPSKLTINGGIYKDAGEGNVSPTSVHLLSADAEYPLIVSGAPVIDDLRLGTDRMLTIGELTEGASIGVSRFEIAGLFAPGASADYAQYFHAAHEGVSVSSDETGLILVSENPYWAFTATNKSIAPAATIAEALQIEGVGFVKLISDHETTEEITGDVYLELFGHDLSGLTVNGNLYVVDYANNDYEDGTCGSLSCTLGENGSINGGKTVFDTTDVANYEVNAYYAMLANEDGAYSFHRVSVAISHISLDPANDALGYKATVSGDSAVLAAITGYGFNMGVEGGVTKTYTLDGAPTDGVFTLRLKGIMAANGGEMTIIGQPFVIFGEDTVTGSEKKTSMKETVEAVETAVEEDANAYTEAQMTAVQQLIAAYESYMTDWNIDAIKAWTVPTVEETPAA